MVKRNKFFYSILASCLFSILITCHEQKKLAIIITSYNNADWFDRNIGMMFCQKNFDGTPYQNYRIIYIDDCSLDATAELVECYIHNCNQSHRCTLIKNKTRKRALANLYYAIQLCEPDEIVFNMDGDDWLADEFIFAMINQIYQDPNIWITYGSFINWPTNEIGYCQPISSEYVEKQLFRKKWWKPGQLRTFYGWLAHQIKLKDLLFEGPYFQGEFFPANSDLAIYYPMMEMAGFHYQFIPELIYIRNVATPINDFKSNKEVQILGSKLIREKELYKRLDKPAVDYFKQFESQKADLILFSENPLLAQKMITSCEKLVRNLQTMYVVFPTNAQKFEQLQSSTYAIKLIETDSKNFKEQLLSAINQSNEYLLFACDGMIFNHYADCAQCILELEKKFAYGFYMGLGSDSKISHQNGISQPVPALNKVAPSIYAWAFHYADSGDWRCYNTLSATVYRKKTILDQIQQCSFSNYHELFEQWSKVPINLEQIGLCYETSRIGYIN
jgi:glycosyltransferase involved in cell wall biosynthesis